MGRSSAERQRRYIARLKAAAQPPDDLLRVARLELQGLRDRIADLERELALERHFRLVAQRANERLRVKS
jgi:hypothetical protein